MREVFLKGNTDEALLHAERMMEKIDRTYKIINTNRIAFDAVVNTKLIEASAKGININYKVMCSIENSIEDEDLISLLGNVLDNAIEACENVDDNKEISLDIKKDHSYLFITVKNTIFQSILKNNPQLKSTKKDIANHGIGIKNVKKIVEKYNGFVTYEEENNEFICKIMLLV